MTSIHTRRELATLLERQMTTAATRPAGSHEDDLEARTALKTYLLQAHGTMRSQPFAALSELAARFGLEVRPTRDEHLVTLRQDDVTFWADTSTAGTFRLHTTATVKEADRIHEALVQGTTLLEPLWVLPAALENLARRVEGKMALFSLRHDRRALRSDADSDDGETRDEVDLVTLRFWAPSAAETLSRLRESRVLPGATSVYSVRVRVGPPEAHALTEVFHNGKLTSSGNSFAQLERVIRVLLSDDAALAGALETSHQAAVRLHVAVRWPFSDIADAVGRMFTGGDPFRLWGLPERADAGAFHVRATDVGTATPVLFAIGPEGLSIELPPGTPVSVAVRVVGALQYFVHAESSAGALSAEPLLSEAKTPTPPPLPPLTERSGRDAVARAVLAAACGCWLRGASTVTAADLARAVTIPAYVTPAFIELARTVMTEAAAFEWHEWLRPVLGPDNTTLWSWLGDPPPMATARGRELGRLYRQGQRLLLRLSGGVPEPWMQMSLFGAEALVPPSLLAT